MRRAGSHCLRDTVQRRMLVQRMADRGHRGVVAAAHAGRAHDADALPQTLRQFGQQLVGAEERAGQAVADAHGERGRRCLAIHHDVEMRIERRDLVDLDQRELHDFRQRREMTGVQAAVFVLDEMQVLDQEIASARARAEQRLDLAERHGIDLPPFREVAPLAPPGARVDRPLRLARLCVHHLPFTARSIVLPRAAGDSATMTPARFIASILSSAVPLPPEMMAPA
jgi:hypothetical protein